MEPAPDRRSSTSSQALLTHPWKATICQVLGCQYVGVVVHDTVDCGPLYDRQAGPRRIRDRPPFGMTAMRSTGLRPCRSARSCSLTTTTRSKRAYSCASKRRVRRASAYNRVRLSPLAASTCASTFAREASIAAITIGRHGATAQAAQADPALLARRPVGIPPTPLRQRSAFVEQTWPRRGGVSLLSPELPPP